MVLRSDYLVKKVIINMTKLYALELWILQGKNKNSQGKCIPSACESVCHEIFVSHRQTVRLSSKP